MNWEEDIKDTYIRYTIRKFNINNELEDKNIVKFYDIIVIDNYSYCIILEYCTGPDLTTFIKLNVNIKQNKAKIIMKKILRGLEYLNNRPNKIILYYLKHENIIFDGYKIKLCEYGLCKIFEENSDWIQLISKGFGTFYYLSPEFFLKNKEIKITTKVDIWSSGFILYEMLFIKNPFEKHYKNGYLNNKLNYSNYVKFPSILIISRDCKDFISHCLKFNKKVKYNIYQALDNLFIINKNIIFFWILLIKFFIIFTLLIIYKILKYLYIKIIMF